MSMSVDTPSAARLSREEIEVRGGVALVRPEYGLESLVSPTGFEPVTR